MSVGAVLTLGLGQFGTVNLLPTLGYLSGTSHPSQITKWGNRPLARAFDDEADINEIVGLSLKAIGELND